MNSNVVFFVLYTLMELRAYFGAWWNKTHLSLPGKELMQG